MNIPYENCRSHTTVATATWGCNQTAITGKSDISDTERDLIALPARLGGLDIPNPTATSPSAHKALLRVTAPLVDAIIKRHGQFNTDTIAQQQQCKVKVRQEKRELSNSRVSNHTSKWGSRSHSRSDVRGMPRCVHGTCPPTAHRRTLITCQSQQRGLRLTRCESMWILGTATTECIFWCKGVQPMCTVILRHPDGCLLQKTWNREVSSVQTACSWG